MKNKIKILIPLVCLLVISIYSYKSITQSKKVVVAKTNNESEVKTAVSIGIIGDLNKKESREIDYNSVFSSETQLPTVNSEGSLRKTYDNIQDLYKNAEIVALVKVNKQNVFFYSDTSVATTSTVDLKKIYKGNIESKALNITELGGPIDFSKLPKVDKPGDGKAPAQGLVETTFEGSVVMKDNNTYLVFLINSNDPLYGYNILGAVQGKIKIDEKTKKSLITVNERYLDEPMSLFFLQKQLGGKSITDIESVLK